jgi:hypothetical protein
MMVFELSFPRLIALAPVMPSISPLMDFGVFNDLRGISFRIAATGSALILWAGAELLM